MIVRPATDADSSAITAILEANDEPVTWPDVPRAPYVDHLLTRPRTRVVVGELDGAVVGVAASIEYGAGSARFLSDLYVHPARQSGGVGFGMLRGRPAADDLLLEGSARARVVHPERDATLVAAALPGGGCREPRVA